MTPQGSGAVVTSTVTVPVAGLDLSVSSVLWAAVAVLATTLAARYAARATLRMAHRVEGIRDDLALQASRVVRYGVIILGAGIVLAILGAPIQPVLAVTLLVLAGAFLMVRGIADNFGAGLVIQTRHPVRLGDLVQSSGHLGHVADLNSRSVVLATLDGRTVHLPNRQFMDSPLVNLSARGRVRSEVQVRVRTDGERAGSGRTDTTTGLVEATRAVHGVLPSPAPYALLTGSAPHELTFTLQFWHQPDAGAQVSSRVTSAVRDALASTGTTSVLTWPVPAPPPTRPSIP